MRLNKYFAVLLICILSLGMLSACGDSEIAAPAASTEPPPTEAPGVASEPGYADEANATDEPDDAGLTDSHELVGTYVRVGALRGPTGMGMAPLMEWASDGTTANTYHFTIGGSPDEMAAGLITGELDIAAVPPNLASVLYNRTEGEIRAIAISTLGNLAILDSTDEINDIEDLRGQTINITGQGGIPQFAFEHILRQNGIEPGVDIEIVFNVEHAELASLIVAGNVSLGMLPQPFITTVLNNSEDVRIAIDLTEAWVAANPGSQFIQGVLVARAAFLEEHPDAVELFLRDHEESVASVNASPNEAAELIGFFDIIPAPIARQAIPKSNLVHIDGAEIMPLIMANLSVLYDANPQTVGGAMPSEDFFFFE
ncbi:MAG: ABC transporter substrate-binding protein [Oscillospiraceae bacterium]|nr:ABC transporter substrate-binding protein [Oscillospiraceae bacterium]